jgi:hypothetical protein
MQIPRRKCSRTRRDREWVIVVDAADQSVHQQSISAQQVEIYGERWADRFGRLLRAYEIPQAKLAAVIGLSAPMLSQLISGQRVKISNPSVYGRIVELEERLSSPAMQSADPNARARVLADVTASFPSLTTRSVERSTATEAFAATKDHLPTPQERRVVLDVLSHLAAPAELRTVALAARDAGAGELANLLASAADHA